MGGRRREGRKEAEWPFPMNWIDPSTTAAASADHHNPNSCRSGALLSAPADNRGSVVVAWRCRRGGQRWSLTTAPGSRRKRRRKEEERSNHRNRFITFPNYFTSLNDCVAVALVRPRKRSKHTKSVVSRCFWYWWLRVYCRQISISPTSFAFAHHHHHQWFEPQRRWGRRRPIFLPVVFWRLIGKQHSTVPSKWGDYISGRRMI